jgi:hypothetical protein
MTRKAQFRGFGWDARRDEPGRCVLSTWNLKPRPVRGFLYTRCASAGTELGRKPYVYSVGRVRVFMPISRYDDCGQAVCVRASAVEYKGCSELSNTNTGDGCELTNV